MLEAMALMNTEQTGKLGSDMRKMNEQIAIDAFDNMTRAKKFKYVFSSNSLTNSLMLAFAPEDEVKNISDESAYIYGILQNDDPMIKRINAGDSSVVKEILNERNLPALWSRLTEF